MNAGIDIDGLLRAIPQRRRTIFLLKGLGSMSNAEIARTCGVTPRIVEREVFLAMLRLRYAQEGLPWPWWRRLRDLFA